LHGANGRFRRGPIQKAADEAATKYRQGIEGTIAAPNIAEARKRAEQWEPSKR
jgi:hypothetical protein